MVNQTWLVTAFFFALLLVILYGVCLILSPILSAIIWSAILAILVYPLYASLVRQLRGRATPVRLIVIALITLLVVVSGVELAWFLSDEAVALAQSVRGLLSGEDLAQWTAKPWVQQMLHWWNSLSFVLMDFKINWKDLALQAAQASSSIFVAQVKGLAQNRLLFSVNFVIVLITFFCCAPAPIFASGCAGYCRWTASIKNGCFKISSTQSLRWCMVAY